MAMSWTKITPEDGNNGGDFAADKRIYGLNGQQYPRRSLSIIENPGGFSLKSSLKNNKDDIWQSTVIHFDLLDDSIDMLKRAKDRYTTETQKVFLEHMERASATVKTWPEWKQKVLGGLGEQGVDW